MKNKVCVDFEQFIAGMDPAELKVVLLEYFAESNGQGWELPAHQMVGIRALLADIQLYAAERTPVWEWTRHSLD